MPTIKEIFAAASDGAKKVGRIAFVIHLVLSWLVILGVLISDRDAQWPLIWIFFLPFDFPFSLCVLFAGYLFPGWYLGGLPSPWDSFHNFILPVIIHGVVGPLWYFFLPVFIDGLLTLRGSRRDRSV